MVIFHSYVSLPEGKRYEWNSPIPMKLSQPAFYQSPGATGWTMTLGSWCAANQLSVWLLLPSRSSRRWRRRWRFVVEYRIWMDIHGWKMEHQWIMEIEKWRINGYQWILMGIQLQNLRRIWWGYLRFVTAQRYVWCCCKHCWYVGSRITRLSLVG